MHRFPIAIRQQHIYLPVTIGEEAVAGEFLLDTGAGMTCVSTSFLGRVRLPIAELAAAESDPPLPSAH